MGLTNTSPHLVVIVPWIKSSIGLGDFIKTLTERIGIRQVEGCGCAQRADKLNRLVAFSNGKENG